MKKGTINKKSVEKTLKAMQDVWIANHRIVYTKEELAMRWRRACSDYHIRKIGIDDVYPYICITAKEPTFDDAAKLKSYLLDRYTTTAETKPQTEETMVEFTETNEEAEIIPTGITFDGKMMTSLYIAQETGKAHCNVMRDIRALLGQGVSPINFEESTYTSDRGKMYPCYNITKKGCLILITGYRADLREKILDRWEALETGKATPLAQMDTLDILQLQLQAMKENRDRIKALESRLDARDKEIEQNKLALESIPLAEEPSPQRTERSLVGELVSRWAIIYLDKDYEGAWDKLYREFKYRYHVDLKARAKNEGAESAVAYAETNGYIHNLYVLASGMYGR